MKVQKVALALTVVNVVLLAGLLMQHVAPVAQAQTVDAAAGAEPGALRAKSLEIVDDQGRVRALLAVMPPSTVDGKDYPETVLLRLIDPTSGPVVKLTAAVNGSALNLSDGSDGGLQLFGRDKGSFVRVTSKDGKTNELAP